MATTAREGNPAGKEKRGVSSSSTTATSHAVKKTATRSSSSLSSSSSARKIAAATSPPSDKHIPNYLKPTASSSTDPSKAHTRSSTRGSTDTSAAQKNLNRRRSFDKPPSPARLQKAVQGAGAATNRPVRSSSFTSKTTAHASPLRSSASADKVLTRKSTPARDGSPSSSTLSKSRTTVKKITSAGSKKDLNGDQGLKKKKAPKSVTSESSVELEPQDHNDLGAEHLISEDDEGIVHISDQHEVLSLPDISEMPGVKEHLGDPLSEIEEETKDVNDDDDVDLTPLSQHDQATPKAAVEQIEKEAAAEGLDETPRGNVDQSEEGKEGEEGVEAAHDDDHAAVKEETSANVATEDSETHIAEVKKEDGENAEKEAAEVVNTVSVGEEHETGEAKEAIEETKPVEEHPAPVQNKQLQHASGSGSGSGKKDPQVYNDVIEETSKKLMDQNRRNKVRALAGAFETVISLQDK